MRDVLRPEASENTIFFNTVESFKIVKRVTSETSSN